MHECPDCGQACGCDMEDTWSEAAEDDCCHDCDPSDIEDDWVPNEDDEGLRKGMTPNSRCARCGMELYQGHVCETPEAFERRVIRAVRHAESTRPLYRLGSFYDLDYAGERFTRESGCPSEGTAAAASLSPSDTPK